MRGPVSGLSVVLVCSVAILVVLASMQSDENDIEALPPSPVELVRDYPVVPKLRVDYHHDGGCVYKVFMYPYYQNYRPVGVVLSHCEDDIL